MGAAARKRMTEEEKEISSWEIAKTSIPVVNLYSTERVGRTSLQRVTHGGEGEGDGSHVEGMLSIVHRVLSFHFRFSHGTEESEEASGRSIKEGTWQANKIVDKRVKRKQDGS